MTVSFEQPDFNTQNPELAALEREQAQEVALEGMISSGQSMILSGGWAAKIEGVFGDDYHPRDIDIFIPAQRWPEWEQYFASQGLATSEVAPGKKAAEKGKVAVDCHMTREEGEFLIDEQPQGTFYFPKEGFGRYEWRGYTITAMRPELMYLMEKKGPDREGKQERLQRWEAYQFDQELLQSIDTKFELLSPEQQEKDENASG